jgi:hypothetical protein
MTFGSVWGTYTTWRDDPVVANLGGYVVNLEGSTGPWQVVQALREQSGISTPIRATLWITPW